MKHNDKKQSKSLTERNKKCECEVCGRKFRKNNVKQYVCDSCLRIYR